jgi:hypothetical protein
VRRRQRVPRLKRSFVCLFPDMIDRSSVGTGGNDSSDFASALECLQLDRPKGIFDSSPMFSMPFSVVSQQTFGDFSALRVLKLNVAVEHELLPAPGSFPSLVTLAFTCMTTAVPALYWEIVGTFLRHLPRLNTLQLRHWKRSVSVVPVLSPELRKLDLSTLLVPCADPLRNDHILALAELCPHLEELTIETRRSRGDASEVALYRALGRLPRLQKLCLHLDASPAPFIHVAEASGSVRRETYVEPWFDAWDTEVVRHGLGPHRQGHIRDVFVNSAIDSALATSVFKAIDDTKQALGGGEVLPLEMLELSAFGGLKFAQRGGMGAPPSHALKPYLSALDRKWLVERDVRVDARNVLHVRELDRIRREERLMEMVQSLEHYHRDIKSRTGFFKIWEHSWSTGTPEDDKATTTAPRRSARIAARSSATTTQPAPEPNDPPAEDAWWEGWKSWPLALGS